ncbi:EAL domain-containing protein [Pediococcus inopinatus]|uniref:EAL domain-containing protein n=1 Tax=Pediococcus inopinatus TaxID=114090 RepID=UPI002B25D1CF|nr:EAL domain-containing protein [Pediococcus inopinatus]WPC16694.1 EAL domain-containing protein [Pediococcus inopinatus]
MIRFWGQPKFLLHPLQPIGYELFLREKTADGWTFPNDFNRFPAQQIAQLLVQTAPLMASEFKNISINLDPEQFVDLNFCEALQAIRNQLLPVTLTVELTEHSSPTLVTEDQIYKAAKCFYDNGIGLIIDDVGFGNNQLKRIEALDPFVQEYKFAIQNFRANKTMDQLIPQLTFWNAQAQKKHKLLTVEGIESKDDLLLLKDFQVDMLQGFALGHPVYLPAASDPAANTVLPFNKN